VQYSRYSSQSRIVLLDSGEQHLGQHRLRRL
jgi:hypothetical protein